MKAIAVLLLLPLLASAGAGEVSTRQQVGDNPRQEYFLIDHSGEVEPKEGFKLLVVLPGGNGSADFNPFVTNIAKHAVGDDYLVAQLISVMWTPDQSIIWPTGKTKVRGGGFTSEEFISAVISDIGKSHKLNPEHIYTLTWSSSGPAAYAASLKVEEIQGSFIAMSVFKPDQLPRLSQAKGHRYYLYHSPGDDICPIRMAEEAREKLAKEGATVRLATYEGGHGWHGDLFGALRTGVAWLEQR